MTFINAATLNTAGSRNPEAIYALRSSLNISVLGLQEVDKNAERSGFRDVAREIAGRTAQPAYAEAIRFGHLKRAAPSGDTSYKCPSAGTGSDALYGVALISTYPLAHECLFLGPDASSYWKSPDRMTQREHEPRTALIATISIGSETLWAISTHLAYTKDRSQPSKIRALQIEKIEDYIDKKIPKSAPLLVMCDTNATPSNPDMRDLLSGFSSAPAMTYPVGTDEQPDRQIDYLLSRNLHAIGATRTIADPKISDHSLLLRSFAL